MARIRPLARSAGKTKLVATLSVLFLTLIGAVAISAPAQATPGTSTVHATLNHTIIHRGSAAAITGFVSPVLAGQTVNLERFYGGSWHVMQSHRLNSGSWFAFGVTGLGGWYTYRVVHPVQVGWHTSISATMNLYIQSIHTVRVASFAGLGDWTGPRFGIPVRDFTISYAYRCSDFAPFLSVTWMGDGDGYDNIWSEPANGVNSSGVTYGHDGAQAGYISVGTQADCSWTVGIAYQAWL